jgi:hypothetical protein
MEHPSPGLQYAKEVPVALSGIELPSQAKHGRVVEDPRECPILKDLYLFKRITHDLLDARVFE